MKNLKKKIKKFQASSPKLFVLPAPERFELSASRFTSINWTKLVFFKGSPGPRPDFLEFVARLLLPIPPPFVDPKALGNRCRRNARADGRHRIRTPASTSTTDQKPPGALSPDTMLKSSSREIWEGLWHEQTYRLGSNL